MRKILNDPELKLVSTGDTRWTSHYQAVKAVKVNLRALVMAIHCFAGDLASEAGGLLLTFQNLDFVASCSRRGSEPAICSHPCTAVRKVIVDKFARKSKGALWCYIKRKINFIAIEY